VGGVWWVIYVNFLGEIFEIFLKVNKIICMNPEQKLG